MTSAHPAASADLLATIVAATRRIVEVRAGREPLAEVARRAEGAPDRRGRFRAALVRDGLELVRDGLKTVPYNEAAVGHRNEAAVGHGLQTVPENRVAYNIIAECKRRSPSGGMLCAKYDPVAIATGYVKAGAAAISVLTEPTFFDGALEHLQAIRRASDIPLLRKDFIVSEYQLHEARAGGADAVLLIVAALDPRELDALQQRAEALGLDTLVEVHNSDELSMAIDAGASIIGVNNRDLRTLEVDVRASEALIGRMPRHTVAVSESGLRTAHDLRRLSALGYRGFLIGERFMTRPSPGDELKALLAAARNTKDIKDTKVTRHDDL